MNQILRNLVGQLHFVDDDAVFYFFDVDLTDGLVLFLAVESLSSCTVRANHFGVLFFLRHVFDLDCVSLVEVRRGVLHHSNWND